MSDTQHTVITAGRASTPDGQMFQDILASCDGGNQYHIWQIMFTTLEDVEDALEFIKDAVNIQTLQVVQASGHLMEWQDVTESAAQMLDHMPEGHNR